MPKNKNFILTCFTLFSMTSVLRHFMAHSDCLFSIVLYECFIDQIQLTLILPFNSTGTMACTVHNHVFPLHLLKRCYSRVQRNWHLTFFGKFQLWWLYFVCMFVVTVNHSVILGFCSEYTTVTEYHFHYSVLYVCCSKTCLRCIFISW